MKITEKVEVALIGHMFPVLLQAMNRYAAFATLRELGFKVMLVPTYDIDLVST